MQETETKMKRTILGDTKVALHRNENPIGTKSRDSKKRERTQVKENLRKEEKVCEPPRKIKKRSQQVSNVLHRCCILAGSTEICYVFFFPFLLLILDNQIPEIK